MTLNPTVVAAVADVAASFPECAVTSTADGAGGAWVDIAGVNLGERWNEGPHTLSFHIAASCPYADVYPLFLDEPARLVDGTLPTAVSPGVTFHLDGRVGVQVSRRSNRWDPTIDTPANKAAKVLAWLRGA